jgi:hypothetical protein
MAEETLKTEFSCYYTVLSIQVILVNIYKYVVVYALLMLGNNFNSTVLVNNSL